MKIRLFAVFYAASFALAVRSYAVCPCDPDTAFSLNPEWSGPYAATANVDVNLGNSPAAFVEAAYWQINGVAPSPATVTAHVNALTTLPYWRRIDTVNTLLSQAGSSKARVYSDPWQAQPPFLSAPCKTLARDVGAVMMYFFSCPGGTNCGMHWANTHALGMEALHPLFAYGAQPDNYYDAKDGVGFWYRELLDARYAGLQFLLPNVYGPDITTTAAVDNLAVALADIAGQSLTSQVRIGMFDDTWGWGNYGWAPWNSPPDMSSPAQTNASANKIYLNKWKPFFQKIPSQYWYTVGGKPLIYFYNAGTLSPRGNSAAVIQQCKTLFQADFGVQPYVAVDSAYFDDPSMPTVADNRFTWYTFGLPQDLSRYTYGGVELAHAMVKWDPIGRESGGSITRTATAGDNLVKDASKLQAALLNTEASDLLVFATWNDLGEGTGINRNKDYYIDGAWQPPNYFMNFIRASQSQQSCGATLPTKTSTPTASATRTPTPTASPTPFHGPLVADCEDNLANHRTLWNNGQVVQFKDSFGSTSDHSPWTASSGTAPGAYGLSNYADCWAGSLVPMVLPSTVPYSFLAFELLPGGSGGGGAGNYTSVVPYAPNAGLQFDYKAAAAGVEYIVQLNTQQVTDYGYYEWHFTPTDTAWHTLTVYFPSVTGASPIFSQPGWATPRAWDPTRVGAVIFQPLPQVGVSVNYGLCIDNLTFDVAPWASPTPSATRTWTSSRTPTPTPSETLSSSPTRTPTPTPTPSPSATATPSPTPSPSATDTITVGPSPTPSPSYTESPTFSLTPTPTSSWSQTPSPSATLSWSQTESPSASPTPSETPSQTPTFSETPSSTATPSGSPSASATPTLTVTPSATPSLSPTSTPTISLTVTPGPASTPPSAPQGPPDVLEAALAPNPAFGPGPAKLRLRLAGPADQAEVLVFTPAQALARRVQAGPLARGWQEVDLPLPGLASGVYFFKVRARQGGSWGRAALCRGLILR